MNTLIKKMKTFLAEEEGLTIVEYAIGGSLVAAAGILAFTKLGDGVCDTVETLKNAVNGLATEGNCNPPTP